MGDAGKAQDTVLGGQLLVEYANNRIILRKNNNNSLVIGLDSTGNPVVKVAKAGFDADTAADTNLVFNSAQNVFKIVSTGTVSLNKAANQVLGITTIAHGLGYKPAILAFTDFQGTNASVPYSDYIQNTGTLSYQLSVYVDALDVYFQMLTPSNAGSLYTSAQTVSFKYYLLQESAT